MPQVVFLLIYIILVIFFSGLPSPMASITVQLVMLSQKGLPLLLKPPVFLVYFGPLILVLLTYFRGKKINNRRLFLFPIAAYLTSFIPYVWVWLFGRGNFISDFFNHSLTLFEAFIPLGIHLLCTVMSFRHRSASLPTAEIRQA